MVWKTAVEGSEIGVHFLDQPQLVDLRYAIQECCIIYNNRAQLDISWFNIMGKGSYIKAHSHKGAFVSGAYYPYVEENSCPLIFENGISIAPQIGMLILFPGILEHKTMPNQSEKRITFLDRLRTMRETEFGAFLPVLFALAAIWGYFGFILPLHDLITGEAESFRAIFLSPRNIYNLFMQSAVIAALAVGITVVLLLGEIDLSAAATAGVCAALLGVLVLSGVPGFLACLIVIFVGIIMGAAQGLLVAYVGIPSFVVTLAGLLGYQGLMQKILPTGNLNVGDPFVRSIARLLIPDMWGLFLALVVFVLFALTTIRKQVQRKEKGLELDSKLTVWFQICLLYTSDAADE